MRKKLSLVISLFVLLSFLLGTGILTSADTSTPLTIAIDTPTYTHLSEVVGTADGTGGTSIAISAYTPPLDAYIYLYTVGTVDLTGYRYLQFDYTTTKEYKTSQFTLSNEAQSFQVKNAGAVTLPVAATDTTVYFDLSTFKVGANLYDYATGGSLKYFILHDFPSDAIITFKNLKLSNAPTGTEIVQEAAPTVAPTATTAPTPAPVWEPWVNPGVSGTETPAENWDAADFNMANIYPGNMTAVLAGGRLVLDTVDGNLANNSTYNIANLTLVPAAFDILTQTVLEFDYTATANIENLDFQISGLSWNPFKYTLSLPATQTPKRVQLDLSLFKTNGGQTFAAYIAQYKEDYADDTEKLALLPSIGKQIVTYGLDGDITLTFDNFKYLAAAATPTSAPNPQTGETSSVPLLFGLTALAALVFTFSRRARASHR
jgi:LPXTG-motif cell wall-anchored protein